MGTGISDLGLTPEELQGILEPLLDVEQQPEFDAVCENCGVDVGIAYAVGVNSLEALAAAGEEDWIEQLIREAYQLLSAERQAKIATSGF